MPAPGVSGAFYAKGKTKRLPKKEYTGPDYVGGKCEVEVCTGRNGIPMLILVITNKSTGEKKQLWVCSKHIKLPRMLILSDLIRGNQLPPGGENTRNFVIGRFVKQRDGRLKQWEPSDTYTDRQLINKAINESAKREFEEGYV